MGKPSCLRLPPLCSCSWLIRKQGHVVPTPHSSWPNPHNGPPHQWPFLTTRGPNSEILSLVSASKSVHFGGGGLGAELSEGRGCQPCQREYDAREGLGLELAKREGAGARARSWEYWEDRAGSALGWVLCSCGCGTAVIWGGEPRL